MRESSAQQAYSRELARQWSGPNELAVLTSPRALALGQPFAVLRIPQFGPSWQFAVVQGTGQSQLAVAPGHVPGSALPGQVGNFAVAGHRVTAGNPFWSLPSLHDGSVVDVVTLTGTYEYRLTGNAAFVPPDDNAVLAPVPYHPGERPQRPMITLITCDPPWTGTRRVIVTGVLVRTLPRRQGG